MMDLVRLYRQVGVIFDCDTTGCYDHILPPLQSIHIRCLELPKSMVTLLEKMMYQCKIHVNQKKGCQYILFRVGERKRSMELDKGIYVVLLCG